MALKLNYNNNNKIYEDTYARIDVLQTSKINSNRVEVTIYANNNCNKVIDTQVHNFAPDYESDKNFTQQAYDYLKTLDSFKEATDC